MQHHLRERVHSRSVITGRDDHQLWTVAGERRSHDPLDRRQVGALATAGRQRNIDVGPRACARSILLHRAGIRREVAVLVQRDREHGRVLVERLLDAVAVVDVPIDDRHALQPAGVAGVCGGDRGVVEDAEPAA